MNRRQPRRLARAALLLTMLAATCAVGVTTMWSVDDPRFAPPGASPDGWADWAAGRDPLDALAAVARLAATVAVGILLLVCAAHLVACLSGSVRLRRRTERLLPAPLAALVAAAVLGSGPAMASAAGAAEDPAISDGVTMRLADGVTMHVVADDPPTTTTAVDPEPEAPPPNRASSPTPPPIAATEPEDTHATPTVTVGPGDHLWGIAERRLRLGGIVEPSEQEVRSYWSALLAANADRLVDPGNPDLVLVGQELILPG